MPSTYTPIQTYTLASTQADVTFTSISGTYTDLVLVVTPTTTSANSSIFMQFNADTGTNYSVTYIYGSGSVADSDRITSANQGSIAFSSDNTTPFTIKASIQNYSNSTTNKTYLSRSSAASSTSGDLTYVGLWRSTAAITAIKLYPNTGSFTSGSVFTLYGIKAA
jgi:hypothetical protein